LGNVSKMTYFVSSGT